MPPKAGPEREAVWLSEAFHAVAFARIARGIAWGSMVNWQGLIKARAIPVRNEAAKIPHMLWCSLSGNQSSARTQRITAESTEQAIALRYTMSGLLRSTIHPAKAEREIAGRASARPIRPR